MRYILFSVLLLVGCDSVVKSEKLGEPVVREETVSCRHYDYCYTCMGGNCGFKFSIFCPGKQKAIVSNQQVRHYYESGNVVVNNQSTVVEELEVCH